jgi:hypothetical protein
MERNELTSSIEPAGVMATACTHRRPHATRNTGSPNGDRGPDQLVTRERQAGPYGVAERSGYPKSWRRCFPKALPDHSERGKLVFRRRPWDDQIDNELASFQPVDATRSFHGAVLEMPYGYVVRRCEGIGTTPNEDDYYSECYLITPTP